MIPLFYVLTFLVGASIGSFLNVCIARWPAELSVVRPRSRCPRCERPIAWYDNIPIASWLVLRAKCRHCGLPISAQYPLVEAVVGAAWLWSLWEFGYGLNGVRVAVAATVLLGIAITDAKHYLIPDGFTVFGFLFALVMPVVGLFVLDDPWPFAGPWDALIGACVGAGLIRIIGWLGEVALGKEAMGQGDETLMAFVGAMVGPGRTLLTTFFAAFLAVLAFGLLVAPVGWLRSRRAGTAFELPHVPFGVFLAPAGMLALLFGDQALAWYLSTLG